MATTYSWSKYISFGTVRIKTIREYAADFLSGLVLLPVEVAIVVLIWRTIYRYVEPIGGFDLDTMVAYQLLVHNLMRGTWSVATVNYRVWQDVRQGKLDVYLARPLDYQLSKLAGELGEIALRSLSRLIMFLLACLALRLPILSDPLLWLLFLPSAAGGVVIKFLEQFMIATMAFWMEAIFGVRDLVVGISGLLAGGLIPISAMPLVFRLAAMALPFQFIFFVPAAIYLGRYSYLQALGMIVAQALWIVAMFLCSRRLWRRGLARYEAWGG